MAIATNFGGSFSVPGQVSRRHSPEGPGGPRCPMRAEGWRTPGGNGVMACQARYFPAPSVTAEMLRTALLGRAATREIETCRARRHIVPWHTQRAVFFLCPPPPSPLCPGDTRLGADHTIRRDTPFRRAAASRPRFPARCCHAMQVSEVPVSASVMIRDGPPQRSCAAEAMQLGE